MAWTADDLLSSVKRRAQLPSSDGKLSDTDILAIADERTATTLAELVRSARSEYWVRTTDISLVADQSDYRIPERAQGANLRDVQLLDSNDNAYNLPQVSLERVDYFDDGGSWWWPNDIAFAVIGDVLRIAPTPTSAGDKLRIRYYRRPSRLVKTSSSEVTKITKVVSSTSFEVDDTSGFSANDSVDIIEGTPNFDSLLDGDTVDAVGAELDLTTGSSDAAVGDYICQAGVTPYPQIPAELHPVLVRATMVDVLEATGDRDGMRLAAERLRQEEESALRLIQPRVEGAAKKVVSWNSPLRKRRFGGW